MDNAEWGYKDAPRREPVRRTGKRPKRYTGPKLSHKYVAKSVDEYFKSGGKITVLEIKDRGASNNPAAPKPNIYNTGECNEI